MSGIIIGSFIVAILAVIVALYVHFTTNKHSDIKNT